MTLHLINSSDSPSRHVRIYVLGSYNTDPTEHSERSIKQLRGEANAGSKQVAREHIFHLHPSSSTLSTGPINHHLIQHIDPRLTDGQAKWQKCAVDVCSLNHLLYHFRHLRSGGEECTRWNGLSAITSERERTICACGRH